MIIAFFVMGYMVKESNEGILFDVALMDYIHNSTNPIITSIMKFISFIGSATFLVPAIAMVISYAIVKKKYYITKLILLSTAGSWILNFLLKEVFQRTRPVEYFLVNQGGLSFPSGHSMVTMTFYTTLAYLLAKNTKNANKTRLIKIIAYVMIILMGISRI